MFIQYEVTSIKDGYLEWNSGYKSSLTYIDGFDACDLDKINQFGKSVDKTQKKCAAVIHKRNNNLILDKEHIAGSTAQEE